MAVESTIIRDAKGTGGVVGLTRKEPALVRWMLTRHHLAEYSSALHERSGRNRGSDSCHEQLNPAAMIQDEQHAVALLQHVDKNMINPFRPDDHPENVLVNISTGMLATAEVQTSLLTVLDASKEQSKHFMKATLTSEGCKSLHCPLKKTKLTTFTNMVKATNVRIQGKPRELNINAEMVFRRALKVAQVRHDVTMKSVLSQPVTSIPTSLFNEDGTFRKTTKSDLIHELESKVESLHLDNTPIIYDHHVYIRDGMAELQSMGGHHHTFEDLAKSYLTKLLQTLERSVTVVDVFDRYDLENSIKGQERLRRQMVTGATKQYQVSDNNPIPPWQKFMAVSSNKLALTRYLTSYIIKKAPTAHNLFDNREIIIAGGTIDPTATLRLTRGHCDEVKDLFSVQEEADTRILLQAVHADQHYRMSQTFGEITIKSHRCPDFGCSFLS